MSQIILKINEQIADIGNPKDLNIKFNRTFIDLQNIDSRQGEYSYSIKLPKTKSNNLIFENINVQNVVDKFIRTEDYNYFLDVDGTQYSGIFKLLSIDNSFYIGNLLGKNIAWSTLLKGKNLNDLINSDGTPWSSPFYGISGVTTTNSLQWYIHNANYDNSDICFPLISRGMFWHSFSGNSNTINNIYSDSVTLGDIPPAVYHGKIVKKIFENIGWTVDSDLFGDAEYKKLILPYTTSDQYTWNYETLIDGSSSGSSYHWYTGATKFYSDVNDSTYNLVGNADNIRFRGNTSTIQAGLFQIKDLNTIISNTHQDLEVYSFKDYQNNTLTRTRYSIPVFTEYDVDVLFNIDQMELTQVPQGFYGPASGDHHINAGDWKAGIVIYVTDGTSSLQNDIFQDITDNYFFNKNPTASPTHSNIICFYDVVQKAMYNKYGQTKKGYEFFYQNYERDTAEITVTDNLFLLTTSFITDSFDNWSQFIISGQTQIAIKNVPLDVRNKLNVAFCMLGNAPDHNNPFHGILNIPCMYASTGIARCDINPSITGDTELNITKNLPDISCLDFLRSWVNQYSMFITTDSNKKSVRFDTENSFFLPLNFKYDLSNKVDLNNYSPPFKPVDLPKNLTFQYSNDTSDILLTNDPDFGSITLTNDNIYSQNDKNISQLYSTTKMRGFTAFVGTGNSVYHLSLPSICTDNNIFENIDATSIQWNLSSSPRLLKTKSLAIYSGTTTAQLNVDGYFTEILLSTFEDTGSTLNLRYDQDNGLYGTYYERYLNAISDSHILGPVDAYINGNDFNAIQPNVPVVVNGESYIINSIQGFDPINIGSKCKIELIKRFTN